jgi:hypothetical protein
MIELGDYVQDRWGDNGSVVKEYDNFWETPEPLSMSRSEWLQRQMIPPTQAQLSEKWVTIHCESGGSIMTFESSLTLIERPNLDEIKNGL